MILCSIYLASRHWYHCIFFISSFYILLLWTQFCACFFYVLVRCFLQGCLEDRMIRYSCFIGFFSFHQVFVCLFCCFFFFCLFLSTLFSGFPAGSLGSCTSCSTWYLYLIVMVNIWRKMGCFKSFMPYSPLLATRLVFSLRCNLPTGRWWSELASPPLIAVSSSSALLSFEICRCDLFAFQLYSWEDPRNFMYSFVERRSLRLSALHINVQISLPLLLI